MTRSNNAWLIFFITTFMTSTMLVNGKNQGVCSDFEIVERDEWRARPRTRDSDMMTPVNHVIIIHTVTPMCRNEFWCKREVFTIQGYHMDGNGWSDIAYSFLIGGDGRIYVGRGWNQTGLHSINFNRNSIGMAFIGDFRTDVPTDDMLNAALKFIDCGVQQGYITPSREIHGHRDVACTESPGDKLYEIIKKWRNFKGGRIENYNCQKK